MADKIALFIEGNNTDIIPSPTSGSYLRRKADGTGFEWSEAGGSQTLAEVLSQGNETDGYNIILTDGDLLKGADDLSGIGGNVSITSGSGLTSSGDINIYAASISTGIGGDVSLNGGNSSYSSNERTGGNVGVIGGYALGEDGYGGIATLSGGNASGLNGIGGNVVISSGIGTSSSGEIIFEVNSTTIFDINNLGFATFYNNLTIEGNSTSNGINLLTQSTVPGGTPSSNSSTIWVRESDGYVIHTDEYGTDTILSNLDIGPITLKEVLNTGNITDGYDIVFSNGDSIVGVSTLNIITQNVTSSINGGNVNITPGSVESGTAASTTISAGIATSNTGGVLSLYGGTGSSLGGNALLQSGTSTAASGTGGSLSLISGAVTNTSGNTGDILITTANDGGSGVAPTNSGDIGITTGVCNGVSGSIAIIAGAGVTSGTVSIGTNGVSALEVNASGNTDVLGHLSVAGKLTVAGLIDPTGLVLDTQSTTPGGDPNIGKSTLWVGTEDGYLKLTDSDGVTQVITPGITFNGAYDAIESILDTFTATAGQTEFTLTYEPLSGIVSMVVEGLVQDDNDVSLSGTSITYSGDTLLDGESVEFRYLYGSAFAINQPSLAQVLDKGNDANELNIINLANPINDQDAVTKSYVDNLTVDGVIDLTDDPYNVRPWSQTVATEYCHAEAASTTLTTVSITSFQDGDGIVITQAGEMPDFVTPPAPVCNVYGTPGATSRTYAIGLMDEEFGMSIGSDWTTVTNAAATLDNDNFVEIVATEIVAYGYREENVNVSAMTVTDSYGKTYSTDGYKSFVLLTAQTDTTENGLWQVQSVGGGTAVLTRPSNWNTGDTIPAGTLIAIGGGVKNRAFQITTDVIVDTDACEFTNSIPWVVMYFTSDAGRGAYNLLGTGSTRTGWSAAANPPVINFLDVGSALTTSIYPGMAGTYKPTVASRGVVARKIVSGAGTTSLVLNEAMPYTEAWKTCIPDNSVGIKAALEESRTTGKEILFPYTASDEYIYCWQSLYIDFPVTLKGHGKLTSRIRFAPSLGIYIQHSNVSANGTSGAETTIKDLYIRGDRSWASGWYICGPITDTSSFDSDSERKLYANTSSGLIFAQTQVNIKDCLVAYTGGSCIYLVGVSDGDGSNCNLSDLTNVDANQADGNGFHIEGYDASQLTFVGCSAIGNDLAGFFDAGFTGSNFYSCHTSSNARPYISYDYTSRALFSGCYSEGDQASSFGRTGCTWLNGNHGAAIEPLSGAVSVGERFTPIYVRSENTAGSGSFTYVNLGREDVEDLFLNCRHSEDLQGALGLRLTFDVDTNAYRFSSEGLSYRSLEFLPRSVRKRGMALAPNGLLYGTSTDHQRFLPVDTLPVPMPENYDENYDVGDVIKDTTTGGAWYVPERSGYGPTRKATSDVYLVGWCRIPSTETGYCFVATTNGSSAASEPAAFATAVPGDTVTDGTLEWLCWGRYGDAPTRSDSEALILGMVRQPATPTGWAFVVTTAGTTDSSEPAGYQTARPGDVVTDGTAELTCQGYAESPVFIPFGAELALQFGSLDLGNSTSQLYFRSTDFDSSASSTMTSSVHMVPRYGKAKKLRVQFLDNAAATNCTVSIWAGPSISGLQQIASYSITAGVTYTEQDLDIDLLKGDVIAIGTLTASADSTSVAARATLLIY